MSNIVILNGPSSAGKSSIAIQMQAQLRTPYLHIPLDAVWSMVPKKFDATIKIIPRVKDIFADVAFSAAHHGHDIIADVVAPPAAMDFLKERLKPFNVFAVGVTAPLDILKKRELTRKDRKVGLAQEQYFQTLSEGGYDLLINTGNKTSKVAAQEIIAAFKL